MTSSAYNDFISGPTSQSTSNKWQYFEINSTRSTASLLSNWQTGNEIISTYGQWDNNLSGGNYPFIQRVTGTGTINTAYGTTITGPALVIHPDNSASGNIGVGYKNTTASTINLTVDISLSFLYPGNNTDGVSYFIQRGLVNDARFQSYASSSIPAGSSSVFTFNNTNIELQSGEIVYLIVNRNGIYFWDHLRAGFSITESNIAVTLTFANPPTTKNVTDAPFIITASSASPGAITYTSSNTSIAAVNATTGLVTLKSAGTLTITAAQAAVSFYNAPTNATYSIVVSPAGSALAGQTVSPSTSFSQVDLSGASFVGTTLSGVSFSGATLTNVNFSGAVITGTDFTNANISGATNLPAFSTVQKLQLLKNINNAAIGAVQVSTVTGSTLASAITNPITITGIENLTFSVVVPTTLDASANKTLTLTSATIASSNIYLPVNTSDVIKINGIIYRSNGTNILDANNEVVNFISIDGVPFRVYAGSFVGINTLSSLNSLKVNGSGVYDAMKSVYLLTSGSNAGAGSALPSNTIAALNATKINGDGLYDILNGLLQNL
jgi:hypothetical protein